MEIPGFTDLTEIGRGGFGTVYRAPQPGFGRDVAIQVLDVTAARLDDRARRRFENETETTGRLSGHPHIVTLHHAGFTPEGRPYLVMAHLPGGSLGQRLAPGAALLAGGGRGHHRGVRCARDGARGRHRPPRDRRRPRPHRRSHH